MPEPDFQAAIARVERAYAHREEMWAMSTEHLEAHPIEKSFVVDDDHVRIKLRSVEPFPVGISVVFSEWLHCLRSALDSLIYELAIRDSATDPPPGADRLQFPVARDADAFAGLQLKGLSERTRRGIESMQAYHATGGVTGGALWWLHRLARIDRHRRHHPFAWRVVDLHVNFPAALFVEGEGRVCEQGNAIIRDHEELELAVLRRRPGARPQRDDGVDVTFTVNPDIPGWIDEMNTSANRFSIDDRMAATERFVGTSIEMFRDGKV